MLDTVLVVEDPHRVHVLINGTVGDDEKAHVHEAFTRTMARSGPMPAGALVRVTRYRGASSFTVVQANATVERRLIRAQSAAPTVAEAVSQTADRLSHLRGLLVRQLAALQAGPAGPAPVRWQLPVAWKAAVHGHLRPRAVRGLVRSKTVRLAVQNPQCAALTMVLRDYAFHMFTDDETGADSILYRGGTTFGVVRSARNNHPAGRTSSALHAPTLAVPEAVEQLNNSPAQPQLFFTDLRTGRGSVLYRRFDGHLGVIAPAY